MRRDAKPVASFRAHRRGSRIMSLLLRTLLAVLVLALVLAALSAVFWYRAVPRRTLIRNAEMTSARQIASLLELDHSEPFSVLASKTKSATYADFKWLKGVDLGYSYPSNAVLTPRERKPLLRVIAGSSGYWLCDDAALVKRAEGDDGPNFELIGLLPLVKFETDPGENRVEWADSVCLAVACIQETMPGMISTVKVGQDGSLTLIDNHGLPIRLGQPEYLPQKIGALPKALRLCEEHRDQLEYLDARNHKVFYENWKTVVD